MKAVVTLGKYFGPKHPRKGQETGFIAKVADGRKVHTCRSNYGYWRAKIEKITATGGVLSVRQWSAKPYRSPQEVITEIPAGIVGVQRLALRRERRVIRTLKAEKKELACRLSGLSSTLIQVLKVKSLRGCEVKNWVGFQNGNGTDVGQDIERLIKRAEREQKYLLTVKHE